MVQVAREVVVGGWQAREEVLAGRYEGCGRWLQPQTAWMEASAYEVRTGGVGQE